MVDPAVLSDSKPRLSSDFGILKLEASHVLNQYHLPIVLLGGFFEMARSYEAWGKMASIPNNRQKAANSRRQLP